MIHLSRTPTTAISVLLLVCLSMLSARADVIRVPQDQPSIQKAVDAAHDGDSVIVSRGTYRESIRLGDRQITLASRFLETRDPEDIRQTILDGMRQGDGKASFVIEVGKNRGTDLQIIGFTIQNGGDGITCGGYARILHNRFLQNGDAIDYEDGGGVCQFNFFESNGDDAVDLDGASGVLIADNEILRNDDDGIEIRLHQYSGPTLQIVIQGNRIIGNGEDGIQLIDYPDRSDRLIRIERNVIADNRMAAVGCMGDGNTRENYEGANIPEPVELIHNTILRSEYGLTGGDHVIALNNVIADIRKSALKKVDADSVVAHLLIWNSGQAFEQSNVDGGTLLLADPLLDQDFRPRADSPCIDAGTAQFTQNGVTLFRASPDDYVGSAPDLGAFEFGAGE